MSNAIGFIGFGEASSIIAAGLVEAGAGPVFAYDVKQDDPVAGPAIREKAAAAGVTLAESFADLAAKSRLLFSFVVSAAAVKAAEGVAPHLRPEHLYVDFNSASPGVKQQVAAVIDKAGARFCEAAVMAAVPTEGLKVPLLLAGPAAAEFEAAMRPWGMRMEVMEGSVGAASAVKMFRSVLIKGLGSLVLESSLAAARYGAADRVFESAKESTGFDLAKFADYITPRQAFHAERRGHEMEEVAETLREAGVDPLMSEACARQLHWLDGLDLRAAFDGRMAPDNATALDAIRRAQKPSAK